MYKVLKISFQYYYISLVQAVKMILEWRKKQFLSVCTKNTHYTDHIIDFTNEKEGLGVSLRYNHKKFSLPCKAT